MAPAPRHDRPGDTPRRRARRALLMCAALGPLAACGLIPPPNLVAPSVTVSDLTISDLGLETIRFVLTLDTENRNDVEVPLTDLSFDLDLFGRGFATGRAAQRTITLARGARTAVPIEFSVPTARLLDTLRELRLTGDWSLAYHLRGSAKWGASPFPVRFERKGDIEVLRRLRSVLQPLQKL